MNREYIKRPELLSPAGNFEKLKAALLYGADAVYLAGNSFGMRAAPSNFNFEQLKTAADYAHSKNVKIYLLVGMRSIISLRCDITPILRPWFWSCSSASIALLRVSLSSAPNPSSMNREFMLILFDDMVESASDMASDVRNVSPPDSVCTERQSDIISRSMTFIPKESRDMRESMYLPENSLRWLLAGTRHQDLYGCP